jgi:hypothetical protein
MQQHTGQHVLSAVFEEWFGLRTVSFHLGAESSTIDLEGGPVEPGAVLEAERRANDIVFENRPVAVDFQMRPRSRGCAKPRTAKAPCASFPSMGSTAALAAEPTCAPPGRWGPSSCASSTRCGRPSVSNSCAAGGRCGGRARITRRCPKRPNCFRRRSTKSRRWWRRSWKRRAPTTRRGASWNSTSRPTRAGNSTWRRSRARTACGASRGAW